MALKNSAFLICAFNICLHTATGEQYKNTRHVYLLINSKTVILRSTYD
jgi:hypothetical protein